MSRGHYSPRNDSFRRSSDIQDTCRRRESHRDLHSAGSPPESAVETRATQRADPVKPLAVSSLILALVAQRDSWRVVPLLSGCYERASA